MTPSSTQSSSSATVARNTGALGVIRYGAARPRLARAMASVRRKRPPAASKPSRQAKPRQPGAQSSHLRKSKVKRRSRRPAPLAGVDRARHPAIVRAVAECRVEIDRVAVELPRDELQALDLVKARPLLH